MEWVPNPEIWIALATLTALEIVLGIDNIIFISILSTKLPQARPWDLRSPWWRGSASCCRWRRSFG